MLALRPCDIKITIMKGKIMITKIKSYLFALASVLMLAAPVAVPVMASAACTGNIANNIQDGVKSTGATTGNCNSDANKNDLGNIAKNVVNIFSYIVGAIAVIMIIYGGFRYITSGGSSDGVGAAKNTLIYAIIGLIIVALAQIIVQFVLSQSADITS